MKALQRQLKIEKMLRKHKQVEIPALAAHFAVSEMTIRRDLDRLAETGRVHRTHGGAVPAERMAFEFDFTTRRQSHRQAKLAIAAEARTLVTPGQRLIIDTGTTTLELAHMLREAEDLTVITPSLAVASELQFSEGIQTVLLGGVVRKGSPDLTGIVAENVLDLFTADLAFQGADGIDLDGALYTADMRIAKVDEKIRSRARTTYILADSSKIGKTALVRHGYAKQAAALITDDNILPEHRRALEELGITIRIVSSHP